MGRPARGAIWVASRAAQTGISVIAKAREGKGRRLLIKAVEDRLPGPGVGGQLNRRLLGGGWERCGTLSVCSCARSQTPRCKRAALCIPHSMQRLASQARAPDRRCRTHRRWQHGNHTAASSGGQSRQRCRDVPASQPHHRQAETGGQRRLRAAGPRPRQAPGPAAARHRDAL